MKKVATSRSSHQRQTSYTNLHCLSKCLYFREESAWPCPWYL